MCLQSSHKCQIFVLEVVLPWLEWDTHFVKQLVNDYSHHIYIGAHIPLPLTVILKWKLQYLLKHWNILNIWCDNPKSWSYTTFQVLYSLSFIEKMSFQLMFFEIVTGIQKVTKDNNFSGVKNKSPKTDMFVAGTADPLCSKKYVWIWQWQSEHGFPQVKIQVLSCFEMSDNCAQCRWILLAVRLLHENTKHCHSVFRSLASHLGGSGLCAWSRVLVPNWFFMMFLSPFNQILGCYCWCLHLQDDQLES